jgi:hypothetical protein
MPTVADYLKADDDNITQARQQVATQQRPGWVQGLQSASDVASALNPVNLLQKVDPLGPQRPLKEKLWNAAMLAGPFAGEAAGLKLMPGIAKQGLFPSIARAGWSGVGGAAAGVPFGKPVEGAISGMGGALSAEGLNYLGRGVAWALGGGASGVMKRFVNALGEATGLVQPAKPGVRPVTGVHQLTDTGTDVTKNVGLWKEKYYNNIYQPIRDQAESLWPKGATSNVMRKIYDAGHGTNVLPPRVLKELEEQSKLVQEMEQLAEKGGMAKQSLTSALQAAKTPQEQAAARDAFDKEAKAITDRLTYLQSLPRYQNIGKDPEVSFEEMEHTISHLRNYGYNPVSGETRGSALGPSERSAMHALKEEMLKLIPDKDVAGQFSTARDHAHAWEVMDRLIKRSEYSAGAFPKIPQVQEEFIKLFDELREALGPDQAEVLIKTLFGGRKDLERMSRSWGGAHGHAHAGTGHVASTLRLAFNPPLLVGPDRLPDSALFYSGIPAAVLGEAFPPAVEQRAADTGSRVKRLVMPTE